MSWSWILTCVFLHMCCPGPVLPGKVLVWPTDASHWLNIKVILQELVARGHEVTVLVNPSQLIFDATKTLPFNFEWYQVPFTQEMLEADLEAFLNLWIYDLANLSYWEAFFRMKDLFTNFTTMERQACDAVLLDQSRMANLHAQKFTVLLSDPLAPCGELVAQLLAIPFVYTFRFSMGNTMERLCGQIPSPPSYVPGAMIGFNDRMSFMERLKNWLFYLSQDVVYHWLIYGDMSQYYSEVTDLQVEENVFIKKVLGLPQPAFNYGVHVKLDLDFRMDDLILQLIRYNLASDTGKKCG